VCYAIKISFFYPGNVLYPETACVVAQAQWAQSMFTERNERADFMRTTYLSFVLFSR
jgi:hypothetical protein